MRQVVQPARGGPVQVVEAPVPVVSPMTVLVQTGASLISAGAERAVTHLAQANLLGKARARPDLVRHLVTQARSGGLGPALGSMRHRLADDLPLGYSAAGTVVEVGAAVRGLRPGQRVATGGGGIAGHAEFQAVPWTLATPLPDDVSDEQAAFVTVAAEGLHGLRHGDVRLGSKVLVVGLGLVGQLTARMAVASGCDVFGIDLDQHLVDLAAIHGVVGSVEAGPDTTAAVLAWSRGRGADTVIITASAPRDSSVVEPVPRRCRDRAVVVAVGDVGLDLNRPEFQQRELALRLSRHHGAGDGETAYETWGVDYPVAHVRWTEGRNQEAVVDLLASRRLVVDDLISHRYPIDEAPAAYAVLDERPRHALGVVLGYPHQPLVRRSVYKSGHRGVRALRHRTSVGIIGAGVAVRSTILPALRDAGYGPVVHLVSASGLSAARLAERERIGRASSDPRAVFYDPAVDLVVIATPNGSHAELAAKALRSGKDVYCEKPLALSWDELTMVEKALVEAEGRLHVGFNRRYTPMVKSARWELGKAPGPVHVHYRVNAGPVPPAHWYADPHHGGRLLGEVSQCIDTCSALVGDQAVTTVACAGSTGGPGDSYQVLLGYADGSTATVLYAAEGHPKAPVERIEAFGAGRFIEIDNFAHLRVNGERVDSRSGRGHDLSLQAFRRGQTDLDTALESTRTTLRAAHALRTVAGEVPWPGVGGPGAGDSPSPGRPD